MRMGGLMLRRSMIIGWTYFSRRLCSATHQAPWTMTSDRLRRRERIWWGLIRSSRSAGPGPERPYPEPAQGGQGLFLIGKNLAEIAPEFLQTGRPVVSGSPTIPVRRGNSRFPRQAPSPGQVGQKGERRKSSTSSY